MQSQTLKSALLVTVFAMGATTTAQAVPVQMSTAATAGTGSASIGYTDNTASNAMYTQSSVNSCGSDSSSYTYSSNPGNPGSNTSGCNSTYENYQDYLNEPGDGGARRTQTVPSSDGAYSATRASEYSGIVSFGSSSSGNTDFYKGYVTEQYTYDADGSEYGGYGGDYGGYGGGEYGGYGGGVSWYTDSYQNIYGDAEAFDTYSFQELALEGVNGAAAAQAFTLNFHIPNSSVYMNTGGGVATFASFVPDEESGGPGSRPIPTTFDADNDGTTDDLDDDDDNDFILDQDDPDRNGDGIYDYGYLGPAFEGSTGVNAEIWVTRGTGVDATSERLWGFVTSLTSNGENIYSKTENLEPGSGSPVPTYNCYFGGCYTSNFYGSLNLGVFDPGEIFSVSYIVRTWVNSAGGTYDSESENTYGYFSGYAQFGDPFSFDGQGFDPLNSLQAADAGVPAPAALGSLGLGLLGFGALRRRRSKK